jgi:hypothetical protein
MNNNLQTLLTLSIFSDSEDSSAEAEASIDLSENTEAPQPEPVSEPMSDAETLEALKHVISERKRATAADGVIAEWKNESEKLKEIYPSFSFDDELKTNKTFSSLVRSGISVRNAYECAHLNEIMSGVIRYAVGQVSEKMAGAVKNVSVRPSENSVLDRASTATKIDVGSLTEKQIMKIIADVGNGAKVTFR